MADPCVAGAADGPVRRPVQLKPATDKKVAGASYLRHVSKILSGSALPPPAFVGMSQ